MSFPVSRNMISMREFTIRNLRRPLPGAIASMCSRSAPLIDLLAFLHAMFLATPVRSINQHRAAWKPARLSHPVNALVIAPANYRFNDFLRAGWPLMIISFVGVLLGMLLFWHL